MVDFPPPGELPDAIMVRGARDNNLRNIDVDVPLWRTVLVVGVNIRSGSVRIDDGARAELARHFPIVPAP